MVDVTYPNYFLPLPPNWSKSKDFDSYGAGTLNDHDWIAKYADFVGQSDSSNSNRQLNELGVFDKYVPIEDIILDDFDFHTHYESSCWNLLETTLV